MVKRELNVSRANEGASGHIVSDLRMRLDSALTQINSLRPDARAADSARVRCLSAHGVFLALVHKILIKNVHLEANAYCSQG